MRVRRFSALAGALAVVLAGSVASAGAAAEPVVVDSIQPGARALDCPPDHARVRGNLHGKPPAPDTPRLTPAETLLGYFEAHEPRALRYERRAPVRHRWTTRADVPNRALFVGLRKNGTVKERFFLERPDRRGSWQMTSTDACVSRSRS